MFRILMLIKTNLFSCIFMGIALLCLGFGNGIAFLVSLALAVGRFGYKVMNYLARKKMQGQVQEFYATGKKRNVKYLIIGDMYQPTEEDYMQISAPGRNLISSYEILKQTHSILRKNGTVVIALKKKKLYKKGYSLFDIFFFHDTTINRLGLQKKKKKMNFLAYYHPIRIWSFLAGERGKRYREDEVKEETIQMFCKERDYQLVFKTCR